MESWLWHFGLEVAGPSNAGHDRLVAGHKVEIKFSTLWEQGDYVFQQLRNQDYEYALLLGVSPLTAHAWLVPKSQALSSSVPQHGGSVGTDTRWIRFAAASPPPWLEPFGGDLERARQVIRTALA